MQPALRPSGPRGKGVKQSTLGIKRSKVKITRGRGYIGRPGGGIVLEFFESSSFSSSKLVLIVPDIYRQSLTFFYDLHYQCRVYDFLIFNEI